MPTDPLVALGPDDEPLLALAITMLLPSLSPYQSSLQTSDLLTAAARSGVLELGGSD